VKTLDVYRVSRTNLLEPDNIGMPQWSVIYNFPSYIFIYLLRRKHSWAQYHAGKTICTQHNSFQTSNNSTPQLSMQNPMKLTHMNSRRNKIPHKGEWRCTCDYWTNTTQPCWGVKAAIPIVINSPILLRSSPVKRTLAFLLSISPPHPTKYAIMYKNK